MKKDEILRIIRSLATSQGSYGRLLMYLTSDTPDAVAYLDYLEKQNFKDATDLVMFIETN